MDEPVALWWQQAAAALSQLHEDLLIVVDYAQREGTLIKTPLGPVKKPRERNRDQQPGSTRNLAQVIAAGSSEHGFGRVSRSEVQKALQFGHARTLLRTELVLAIVWACHRIRRWPFTEADRTWWTIRVERAAALAALARDADVRNAQRAFLPDRIEPLVPVQFHDWLLDQPAALLPGAADSSTLPVLRPWSQLDVRTTRPIPPRSDTPHPTLDPQPVLALEQQVLEGEVLWIWIRSDSGELSAEGAGQDQREQLELLAATYNLTDPDEHAVADRYALFNRLRPWADLIEPGVRLPVPVDHRKRQRVTRNAIRAASAATAVGLCLGMWWLPARMTGDGAKYQPDPRSSVQPTVSMLLSGRSCPDSIPPAMVNSPQVLEQQTVQGLRVTLYSGTRDVAGQPKGFFWATITGAQPGDLVWLDFTDPSAGPTYSQCGPVKATGSYAQTTAVRQGSPTRKFGWPVFRGCAATVKITAGQPAFKCTTWRA